MIFIATRLRFSCLRISTDKLEVCASKAGHVLLICNLKIYRFNVQAVLTGTSLSRGNDWQYGHHGFSPSNSKVGKISQQTAALHAGCAK
jgi:hypothetical protein